MTKEITIPLKVRSYEIDLYGHVNNAVYMNYLEHGRVQALEQTGKSFVEYMKENIFIVVAQANLTFHKPVFLENELAIKTKLQKIGRSSAVLEQEIFNQTHNELSVKAEFTLVFLNEHKKPISVPVGFLSQLGWENVPKPVVEAKLL